jgi:hypothetical protein
MHHINETFDALCLAVVRPRVTARRQEVWAADDVEYFRLFSEMFKAN